MYDPSIGQFLSEDPSMFEGLDPNLRRYVKNDPIQFVDPLGLKLSFAPRPNGMKEEEYQEAKSHIKALVAAIAEEDMISYGGAVARAALSEKYDIKIQFDINAEFPHAIVDKMYLNPRDPSYGSPGKASAMAAEYAFMKKDSVTRLSDDEVSKIVLVHELSHAISSTTDPAAQNPGGSSVTMCENPYRETLDAMPRPAHLGFAIPAIDKVNKSEATKIEAIIKNYPHPKASRPVEPEKK